MNNQARHIYKMIESESIVNIETIKQELEANKLDNNNREEEEDNINPYYEIIMNKVERTIWLYCKWNNGQYLVM